LEHYLETTMDRPYQDTTAFEVKFFIGTEVEKSPAHGKKTLFVVGLQPVEQIKQIASENNIEHIYLGANMSFDGVNLELWKSIAKYLLDSGFWVTLDYKLEYHNVVLEYRFNEHNRFISMISVPLPHIEQLNYNACIKLDDSTFQYSNPGVWVHSVHDLKDRNCFTDWSKYNEDTVIS
jgi:hypothetical protein